MNLLRDIHTKNAPFSTISISAVLTYLRVLAYFWKGLFVASLAQMTTSAHDRLTGMVA